MARVKELSVLERHLPESTSWCEGYKQFGDQLGKPTGWLAVQEGTGYRIVRLDRKGHATHHTKVSEDQKYAEFLKKLIGQIEAETGHHSFPRTYRCQYHQSGIVFSLKHLGQQKGYFILSATGKYQRDVKPPFRLFEQFLRTQVELAYRTFELHNFYETVHPRALALSTIHSVHRVMASSLRLQELLPRIARLCAQVIKAKVCALYLLNHEHTHLIPHFSFGEKTEVSSRSLLE